MAFLSGMQDQHFVNAPYNLINWIFELLNFEISRFNCMKLKSKRVSKYSRIFSLTPRFKNRKKNILV